VRKALIAAGIAMVALTVGAPLSLRAALADFCRDYARAAMNQVRAGLANPGCAAGVKGPRWAPDEAIHFQWCLTQPSRWSNPSAARARPT